jgi:hypothetical protein
MCRSATGTPSLSCFRINALWASENFEAFITLRSSQPGNRDGELWPRTIQFCGLRPAGGEVCRAPAMQRAQSAGTLRVTPTLATLNPGLQGWTAWLPRPCCYKRLRVQTLPLSHRDTELEFDIRLPHGRQSEILLAERIQCRSNRDNSSCWGTIQNDWTARDGSELSRLLPVKRERNCCSVNSLLDRTLPAWGAD